MKKSKCLKWNRQWSKARANFSILLSPPKCCKNIHIAKNPIHFKITFFSNKGTEQFNILTTPSFFIGFSSSLQFSEINHQEEARGCWERERIRGPGEISFIVVEVCISRLFRLISVLSPWLHYHTALVIFAHTNRVVFQCLPELVLTTSFCYCSRIWNVPPRLSMCVPNRKMCFTV